MYSGIFLLFLNNGSLQKKKKKKKKKNLIKNIKTGNKRKN